MLGNQNSFTLRLETGDPLDVRGFTLEDGLSTLFSIDIVARSSDPSLDYDGAAGTSATFTIQPENGGAVRSYTGVISEVHQLKTEETGLTTYQLTLVPKLWLATRRTNCRVFQQVTDLDIVKEVLKDWDIEPVVEVTRPLKTRKYRVQYQESDHAFISRMLEAIGVTYFHRQVDGESKLVLSDAPESAEARLSPLTHVNDVDTMGTYARGFRASRTVGHGRVTLSDHDHRLPNQPLLANAAAAGNAVEAKLEQFLYVPGQFRYGGSGHAETPSADDRGRTRTDPQEAKVVADNIAAAHRARAHRFSFETNAVDVAAGSVVSIAQHPRAEQHPRLLVTRVSTHGTLDGGIESSVSAVPASQPYRPEPVTPRPSINGIEMATVVGPAGEVIHTDEFGRVRVQFHWDRYGKMDQTSSCWVHVNQPWAGDGFGAVNLPRIGQEVIMSFLAGNPDEPVCMGRVYTNLLRPPFALPANKTQNGFRSNSVPATGGYNEIMFEDKAGKELVNLQAEKDMKTLVKHNDDKTVGNNRSAKVKGNDAEHVSGNQKASVLGKVMESVGGDKLTGILGNLVSQVGKERIMKTLGDFASAAKAHRIQSQTGTTLSVGESFIHMTPDAIILQSPKILLNPGKETAQKAMLTGNTPGGG
ncbi:MAG: type VI secretion system tip protein VgrG [Polyangiaceae bacterium]|nr:type VI secretion system tip protein VgrG [Polyangiaceae bacterium]MBK8941589.1 type VI secretion system tip protein VgrG [Polyangiaceae bacterium]